MSPFEMDLSTNVNPEPVYTIRLRDRDWTIPRSLLLKMYLAIYAGNDDKCTSKVVYALYKGHFANDRYEQAIEMLDHIENGRALHCIRCMSNMFYTQETMNTHV